jgi:hypothetical protein
MRRCRSSLTSNTLATFSAGVEEYKKAHGVKFVADDAVELAQLPDADLEKVLLRAEIESDPYKAYQALAGEVEARNVQSRMDMDAATRRATPPWATEDVPRDQQIVRGLLGDSGPQMSVADAENVANSYRVGYNPKPLNQRSFDVDYPRGARSDDTGRLVESQEGVKLDAPFVAGRRYLAATTKAFKAKQSLKPQPDWLTKLRQQDDLAYEAELAAIAKSSTTPETSAD